MDKFDSPEVLMKALKKHYSTDDFVELQSLIECYIFPKKKRGAPPNPDTTKRRLMIFTEMLKLTSKGGMTDRAAAKKAAKKLFGKDDEATVESVRDDWKKLKVSIDPDTAEQEYDRVSEYRSMLIQEKLQGSNLKELAMLCCGSDDKSSQEKVRELYIKLQGGTQ